MQAKAEFPINWAHNNVNRDNRVTISEIPDNATKIAVEISGQKYLFIPVTGPELTFNLREVFQMYFWKRFSENALVRDIEWDMPPESGDAAHVRDTWMYHAPMNFKALDEGGNEVASVGWYGVVLMNKPAYNEPVKFYASWTAGLGYLAELKRKFGFCCRMYKGMPFSIGIPLGNNDWLDMTLNGDDALFHPPLGYGREYIFQWPDSGAGWVRVQNEHNETRLESDMPMIECAPDWDEVSYLRWYSPTVGYKYGLFRHKKHEVKGKGNEWTGLSYFDRLQNDFPNVRRYMTFENLFDDEFTRVWMQDFPMSPFVWRWLPVVNKWERLRPVGGVEWRHAFEIGKIEKTFEAPVVW
jgi:hypothetical protein